MASDVEICNRALQKLGAKRISALSEESHNARSCLAAFAANRDALLESHPWNFAIERFSLAADAVSPAFGKAYSYTLPSGSLRILPPYTDSNTPYRDWIEEGGKILTDMSAPLEVRCIMQVTDANRMSPLFREALASKIALDLCEVITQSNTKKDSLSNDFEKDLAKAKKANGMKNVPIESAEDSWITGRS